MTTNGKHVESTKKKTKILDKQIVKVLVSRSCLALWDLMDYSPPGFSVHGYSPGKNPGVGCHALLQGIFPTQGLNLGLPHCRQVLYHLGDREALDE